MEPGTQIKLRQWRDDDMTPFVEMNRDAEVMRYFPKMLTPEESQAMFLRLQSDIDDRGWGLWAVEVNGLFAGFAGLAEPRFTAHFTPCVEIGWRFRREYWGRGIAYTAALKAERHAFEILGLRELVSFTTTGNLRSRHLMERLGFTHDVGGDFQHPLIDDQSPLRAHVLYRKANPNKLQIDAVATAGDSG